MVVKCGGRGTMDVTQGRSKEKMNVSLRSEIMVREPWSKNAQMFSTVWEYKWKARITIAVLVNQDAQEQAVLK
jgi:hypothetical protein